jgi:hypothetical protein
MIFFQIFKLKKSMSVVFDFFLFFAEMNFDIYKIFLWTLRLYFFHFFTLKDLSKMV